VELGDDGRPLADGSTDALDRAAPDVAHGEDTGNVGLQRAGDGPAAAPGEVVARQVRSRPDEALGIERDGAAGEPFGRGIRPDEEEDLSDRVSLLEAGVAVPPAGEAEVAILVPLQTAQLGSSLDV
jgi:hypothetical protein